MEEQVIDNSRSSAEPEEKSEGSSLKEECRRFLTTITSSSVRTHVMNYTSLAKTVEHSDEIPEPIIKALTKTAVSVAIQKYRRPASFKAVAKLLTALGEKNHNATLKTLAQTIVSHYAILPNLSPNSGLTAIQPTKWLLDLLKESQPLSEEDGILVTSALASLSYYASADQKARNIFFPKKLKAQFNKNPSLLAILEKNLSGIAKEHSEKILPLIASIVKIKNASFAMPTFIEALSKAVLLPKTRPAQHIVDAANPVFERISSSDFNEHLLPVIKKALLRSPEVSMFGVLSVINSVTFSVDAHAEDLLKAALGSAQTADEQLRVAAIEVAVSLTRRAQAPVVTKVVNKLFDQYTSAKTSEVKLDVLSGIQKVATAAQAVAEPDIQKIATDVIVKTAKNDTIEAVVEALWSATVAWATRLPDTAESLSVIFKEASKLPPSVKQIGYRSVVNIFNQKGLSILPPGATLKDLVTEIDTGAKGELSSIPLALMLLKSTPKGSVEHTKVWSRAAHAESVFKEKSLSAVKWQDAVIWAQLIEHVILQRPIVDKTAPAKFPTATLNAFAMTLFWPQYKVREQALNTLTSVLNAEKEAFAEAFAEHLYAETVNGKINILLRKTSACPDSQEWTVPGVWYVQVLKKLLLTDGADLDKLAVHTLLLASIKTIVVEDGAVWLRWMHEQKEAKTWEASPVFRQTVLSTVLSCKERDVRDTALLSLILLNVDSLKEDLWKHVENRLAEIEIDGYLGITEKSVGIFKCQEGHLFNTDVLDFDEGAGMQNMKRENKAYSYQDQLAEIQLKRELAEKRRKEGKLTAKQKQVLEKELAAEKEIRDELRKMFDSAEARLDEARALVEADHAGAFARPLILFNTALPLTKSNLVAEHAAKLFLAYRNAAFECSYDCCGNLVGSNWLRVLGSKWLVQGWAEEDLETSIKRMMGLLNERAFFVEGADEDFEHDEMDIVGAPQLTILYPMLRELLTNDKYSDAIKNDTLQLLQNAINKVFLKNNAVLTVPMEQYASLLLEYVAKTNSTPAFKSLTNLIELVNETGDVGSRVNGMVREVLTFVTNERSEVRSGAIQVLSAPNLLPRLVLESEDPTIAKEILIRLFIVSFDQVEAVADAAGDLWQISKFHIKPFMGLFLVEECVSNLDLVRFSASKALKEFLEEFPEETPSVLSKIDDTYKNLTEIREAVYDNVGRLLQEAVDEWERRSGCALALLEIATIVREQNAEQLIKIVAPLGLVDRHTEVRNQLRIAAVETINRHGKNIKGKLQPFLEKLSDETPADAAHDNRRQGLVVLLGTLAQYLNDSPDKIRAIVARLVEALSTPSQTVQVSVSQCLSPLVPFIKADAFNLITSLQWLLFEAETYGERRGAAYGIAGLIKGMGIIALKEIDLLPSVTKNLVDKKSAKHREGSLLVLEIMCSTIGKYFEPYIVKFLPTLTSLFGDGDQNVRRAADDTAQAMMASLTRFGIKLVLPVMTAALDDDAWRTKCAATEILGSVAFCAPKQLSSCLPSIVPKLIEVLADSSSKVAKSGENALRKIAGVVRNPEILGVVNHLMAGLLDPAGKTSAALQAVLNTKFIHYIDAPSLALMMPIVRRAFEDRNSETRRVAAQIIANIYSLTDSKDMEPYLTNLLPGLQKSLLDPVPDIRTVSAKALGAIVAKAGGKTSEKLHSEVVPWLKEKLISQTSTVDRSGAAQGLCEVLAGVGADQLDFVMPEIIQATESTEVSAETRDGYILMYIYLPLVFGEKFIPYLPSVVPPILKALADENEYVRASALKAGQRLISQYCSHARKHLLPQLQIGLADENWRIRHASVQLIGDFLFTISGVSGKSTTSTANEDDTMGMEQAGKTIIRALGQKDRDRVLAGLYLARSDVALIVRQAAGHVWKIVVSNTPRTLKEVMKHLFEMVVDSLASSGEERQQMGAKCLGELVRKMGDKVINGILPVLDLNQQSSDVSKRVGVAIALHEIIGNMSKEVLNHYLSLVTPSVRIAICDEDAEVREAAANAFSSLYHVVGNEALDEIITPLLESLTPEQDHVLQGLCEVMKQNSKSMLPYLLPKLTKPPVNTHALCSLASVSGDSLSRQLPKVLDALLASCVTNDQYDPMIDSCEKVVIAVTDEEGVPVMVQYLLKKSEKGSVPATVLLHTFIEKGEVQLAELAEELLPGLLHLYSSTNPQIVDHAVCAASALTKSMDVKEQQDLLPIVKKTLNMLISSAKGEQIPGFAHPKGIQPLTAMVRENILQGGQEMKALAGEALGQIVGASTVVALKAHAVNITGPLIRVLGDRYPPSVKLPILDTLSKLLDKASDLLKPFFPQLQSTFMKALQEVTSRPVRLAAGSALAKLFPKIAKQDQTVAELVKFLASSQDLQLTESMLITLRALLPAYAPKLTPQIVQEIYEIVEGIYSKPIETPTEIEKSLVVCSGALLGETLIVKEDWAAIKTRVLDGIESSKTPNAEKIAKIYALQQISQTNAAGLWGSEINDAVRTTISAAFQSPNSTVAASTARTAANILMKDLDRDLLNILARAINHTSLEVRKVVAVALGHVASKQKLQNDLLKIIVPHLVNGTKESNSAVRVSSELSLVYAFDFIESPTNFENYRALVEGVVQKALDDVRVSMAKLVRNRDTTLETLDDILAVGSI